MKKNIKTVLVLCSFFCSYYLFIWFCLWASLGIAEVLIRNEIINGLPKMEEQGGDLVLRIISSVVIIIFTCLYFVFLNKVLKTFQSIKKT